MYVEQDAVSAAVTGPVPDQVQQFSKLENRGLIRILHLRNSCGAEPLTHGPIAHLLASVPDNCWFEVCASCMLEHKYAPQSPRALWSKDLSRLIDMYKHRERARELLAEQSLEHAATDLLDLAEVFSYDQATDMVADTGDWSQPHLLTLHNQAWAEGKELFEQCVARRVGTAMLDEPPRPNEWAVVRKGQAYWAALTCFKTPEVAYQAALLEGVRIGQDARYFVTPVTWGENAVLDVLPRTLPAPDNPHPDAVRSALELWDGRSVDDFERILAAVNEAHMT
jgi:hypothetical protein